MTLQELIALYDSLVKPEYEAGLQEMDDLQNALNEQPFLVIPKRFTKSGKDETININ